MRARAARAKEPDRLKGLKCLLCETVTWEPTYVRRRYCENCRILLAPDKYTIITRRE